MFDKLRHIEVLPKTSEEMINIMFYAALAENTELEDKNAELEAIVMAQGKVLDVLGRYLTLDSSFIELALIHKTSPDYYILKDYFKLGGDKNEGLLDVAADSK